MSMTIDDLDAELRPLGWHAWRSTGRAWPVTTQRWQDGMCYACTRGTTEWAGTPGLLRKKLAGRVRGLAANAGAS